MSIKKGPIKKDEEPVALDKFLNFLISPVLNFLNPLEKAEESKKSRPISADVPLSEQRQNLRDLQDFIHHFLDLNPNTVITALADPNRRRQYERTMNMEALSGFNRGDDMNAMALHRPEDEDLKEDEKERRKNNINLGQHRTIKVDGRNKLTGYEYQDEIHIPTHHMSGKAYFDNNDKNNHYNSYNSMVDNSALLQGEDSPIHSSDFKFGGITGEIKYNNAPYHADSHETSMPLNMNIKRARFDNEAHEEGAAQRSDWNRQRQTNPPIDYRMGDTSIENTLLKLMAIVKEGDGGGDGGDGGGFNGLSGTVFTSANSGIFTPTYGGSKTERRSRKNRKKQDRKRKKILGKDKRNGVDKLVQFLYDGSPMQKAKKPNKDMTGDAATAHAWNNKKSGRMILDWQKVANGNTATSYMGNPGTLDNTSGAATYPSPEDNTNGITPMPKKANWGENQAYVQKAWYDSNEEASKEQALMGRVADTYRSTNIGKTFNEITDNEHHLDASLTPDLTDDEQWLHDEYATTNNRLDQWADYASQNDNYQDNLRHVLGNVATDGKVTVYRGHHKDDDPHSSSKHKHVGVTTSPSTAMKFRGAAVPNRPDEMSSQVPMQDWHISSWNVPVDHITAHGDASEHELIMDKDRLKQHEVTTHPMNEFADNYTGSSKSLQKFYEPLIKVASSAPQNWSMPNGSNPPATGRSPQQLYTEKDKDYEPPGKNADIKQNDMERRIKAYDDKEDEKSNIDQPAASMATRGMGNYPNASMQMMAYGSGPNIDELGRGGEKDISHDEEDIDEKERSDVWVPEDKDDVEKFKKLYKALQEDNDPTPLLTALYKVDHD